MAYVMVRRSVQTRAWSPNIVRARRHKAMRSIPNSGNLEVPGTCSREPVLGTCIGELRRDRGSWHMVRIERTGGLTLGMLSFNVSNRLDSRHAGHPGECHDVGSYHNGKKEKRGHVGQICGTLNRM